MKIRMLDLFCGAGGAAAGYHRAFTAAGFEVEIIGVDIAPQRHYPFAFRQADAMTWPLDGYDFIHASPPCQGYSVTKSIRRADGRVYPMLIEAVRTRLRTSLAPWIIENVAGSHKHLLHFVKLCGTFFDLRVYRHRLFESNLLLLSPGHCTHPAALMPGYMCVAGHHTKSHTVGRYGNQYQDYTIAEARAGMGIEWMNRDELAQAIPPAYTEFLGRQIAAVLERTVAA